MKRYFSVRCRTMAAKADGGMTTAEYCVGTLAACAFAAVLMAVVRSEAVRTAMISLITTALSIGS